MSSLDSLPIAPSESAVNNKISDMKKTWVAVPSAYPLLEALVNPNDKDKQPVSPRRRDNYK
jgi:hypothetical protein